MINKRLSVFLILLFIGNFAAAQNSSNNCDCPKNKFSPTQSEAIFNFSAGESIALCGYRVEDDTRDLFSEFVLTVCGSDTLIDFWDASLLCEVRQTGDSLIVEQIVSLPVGKNYAQEDVAWLIERITVDNGNVSRTLQLNKELRRYSKREIDEVLKQYEQADSIPDAYKMELAGRLFMAVISGDKVAKDYFMRFRERFGILDGAYSQEYHFLQNILAYWDRQEGV